MATKTPTECGACVGHGAAGLTAGPPRGGEAGAGARVAPALADTGPVSVTPTRAVAGAPAARRARLRETARSRPEQCRRGDADRSIRSSYSEYAGRPKPPGKIAWSRGSLADRLSKIPE